MIASGRVPYTSITDAVIGLIPPPATCHEGTVDDNACGQAEPDADQHHDREGAAAVTVGVLHGHCRWRQGEIDPGRRGNAVSVLMVGNQSGDLVEQVIHACLDHLRGRAAGLDDQDRLGVVRGPLATAVREPYGPAVVDALVDQRDGGLPL